MSRTALSPAYRALCRRALREAVPRPAKASDRRRMQSANDSSPDDVPEPWEIDSTHFDCLDCDHGHDRGYLDGYEPRARAV